KLDLAKSLLAKAKGKKFLLPNDHLQATKPAAGATTRITDGPSIEDGWCGVDIGPETIVRYNKEIVSAKTIVWNGPMGIFEIPEYSKGTFEVAKAVAGDKDGISIMGGGETR